MLQLSEHFSEVALSQSQLLQQIFAICGGGKTTPKNLSRLAKSYMTAHCSAMTSMMGMYQAGAECQSIYINTLVQVIVPSCRTKTECRQLVPSTEYKLPYLGWWHKSSHLRPMNFQFYRRRAAPQGKSSAVYIYCGAAQLTCVDELH